MHRLRVLVTILSLTMGVSTYFAQLDEAIGQSGDDLQAYASQDQYGWCDAKLLSAQWGVDITAAKARIGMKLRWNDQRVLEDYLNSARTAQQNNQAARCQFHETRYTYEDATVIARAWQIPISEAKATIERKVFWGLRDVVDHELGRHTNAQGDDNNGRGYSQQAGATTFTEKGYTYCDARFLSALWRSTPEQAKMTGGFKVLEYGRAHLDSLISEGRQIANNNPQQFQCTFWETHYTYDDAARLAQEWSVDIGEAKSLLASKVFYGIEDLLPQSVRRRR